MSWINALWLAEIHRETYVAIIQSWVPHGKRGEFAHQAGISREYLSYLCALDNPETGHTPTKRLPSPKIARKIADVLPAPKQIKCSLIENMDLAHIHKSRSFYQTKEFIREHRLHTLMSDLAKSHQLASFGKDYQEVNRAYRVTRNAARTLLPQISPQLFPASYVQTCLYLHDAQCVLDRADEALKYAKIANLIFNVMDVYEDGFEKEQIDDLRINALRGEAIAYHNLGLDVRIPDIIGQIHHSSAFKNRRSFWTPLVGRDLLNSLALIPRFSIREAKQIAHQNKAFSEKYGDQLTYVLSQESWLRCLVEKGKLKDAQKVYRELAEQIPTISHIGSLHKSLLLKSGAKLAWEMGDKKSWFERISQALQIMHQAGLIHQLRTVKRKYQKRLVPVPGHCYSQSCQDKNLYETG